MKEDDDLSANIKEYLENSPFEVCAPLYLHIRIYIEKYAG